jgi:broad specificity phosphatase PhoE
MIYLIRHGQTEFNRDGRLQGGLDSPLTALGEAQGRTLGLQLATLTTLDTAIVSSPLGRAKRTAALVRESGGFRTEVATDPRLAEVSMGSWDGLTRPRIAALDPGFSIEAPPPDWYMRSPDGETYADIAARIGDWVEEYRDYPGDLIVVSHGVAGRVLRGLYAGLAKDEALRLPVPQDAVFRLHGGRIERFDCAPLPSAVAGV